MIGLKKNVWIERFNQADGHDERAGLLLEMPVFTLMKYRDIFERNCRVTGFSPGLVYIEALRTCLAGRRHRGTFSVGCSQLQAAESVLNGFADGLLRQAMTGDGEP